MTKLTYSSLSPPPCITLTAGKPRLQLHQLLPQCSKSRAKPVRSKHQLIYREKNPFLKSIVVEHQRYVNYNEPVNPSPQGEFRVHLASNFGVLCIWLGLTPGPISNLAGASHSLCSTNKARWFLFVPHLSKTWFKYFYIFRDAQFSFLAARSNM